MLLAIAASDHVSPTSTYGSAGATLFFSFDFGATINRQVTSNGASKTTIGKDEPPTNGQLTFAQLLRPSCDPKRSNSLLLIVATVTTNPTHYLAQNLD